MGKGIERTQILRIDCVTCRGKGYVQKATCEELCEKCEGRGQLEKEVSYKFDTGGRWGKEEIATLFEVSVDEVKDEGHSNGD